MSQMGILTGKLINKKDYLCVLNVNMKMKILLTGGLGFIGFHTAKLLEETTKHHLLIVDAYREYIKHDVIFNPYIRRGAMLQKSKIIQGDCSNYAFVKQIIQDYQPEIIIHFASLPIVWKAENWPELAHQDIEESFKSVLSGCEETSQVPKKIIYISSSMVYGHFMRDQFLNLIPAIENQAITPIDVYGRCKMTCENLLIDFAKKTISNYIIIRPSAVYGPEDYNKRVVEVFLKNAIQNKEIIISGNGELTLDFTYVEDLVKSIVQCVEKDITNETFNITFGHGYTINELAHIVKQLVPSANIKHGLLAPNRPNRTYLNIEKAKSLLGINPQTSLEQGVEKYYKYLIDHRIYEQ
jgi:nucleoside-diphosphate-sugar epimerase